MIPPIPWFERKFDFNFPPGLFPVIVERLRGTIWRLQPLTRLTDERLTARKDGKWSIKEIVGHLYDLEDLWSRRIDDFLAGKETLTAADLSNTKTHEANHNSSKVLELLSKFENARNGLLEKVENLDMITVGKSAIHPRLQKPMRLVDSLFFVAEHDDHELTKIRLLIADYGIDSRFHG